MKKLILVSILLCVITGCGKNENKEEKTLKQLKQDCEKQMDYVLGAARLYGADNVFTLPSEDNEKLIITLGDLIMDGYIEGKVKNPINKKTISNNSEIYITKIGKKWKYELSNEFSCDID